MSGSTGREKHPILGGAIFHTGAIGDAPVWQAVIEATQESRASAREFLDRLDGEQLETVVPYDGSIEYLRPTGLRLSYTLMRCAAHHFEHKGEF